MRVLLLAAPWLLFIVVHVLLGRMSADGHRRWSAWALAATCVVAVYAVAAAILPALHLSFGHVIGMGVQTGAPTWPDIVERLHRYQALAFLAFLALGAVISLPTKPPRLAAAWARWLRGNDRGGSGGLSSAPLGAIALVGPLLGLAAYSMAPPDAASHLPAHLFVAASLAAVGLLSSGLASAPPQSPRWRRRAPVPPPLPPARVKPTVGDLATAGLVDPSDAAGWIARFAPGDKDEIVVRRQDPTGQRAAFDLPVDVPAIGPQAGETRNLVLGGVPANAADSVTLVLALENTLQEGRDAIVVTRSGHGITDRLMHSLSAQPWFQVAAPRVRIVGPDHIEGVTTGDAPGLVLLPNADQWVGLDATHLHYRLAPLLTGLHGRRSGATTQIVVTTEGPVEKSMRRGLEHLTGRPMVSVNATPLHRPATLVYDVRSGPLGGQGLANAQEAAAELGVSVRAVQPFELSGAAWSAGGAASATANGDDVRLWWPLRDPLSKFLLRPGVLAELHDQKLLSQPVPALARRNRLLGRGYLEAALATKPHAEDDLMRTFESDLVHECLEEWEAAGELRRTLRVSGGKDGLPRPFVERPSGTRSPPPLSPSPSGKECRVVDAATGQHLFTVDGATVPVRLYPGRVFRHDGLKYEVPRDSLTEPLAVEPVDASLETVPIRSVTLDQGGEPLRLERRRVGEVQITDATALVNAVETVEGLIRFRGQKREGQVAFAPVRAQWPALAKFIVFRADVAYEVVSTLALLARIVVPALVAVAPDDLHVLAQRSAGEGQRFPALVFVDRLPGGCGLAESLDDRTLDRMWWWLQQILHHCSCMEGCSTCLPPIHPLLPEEANPGVAPVDKPKALSLLRGLVP